MKVLLLNDVKKLGWLGDVVDVSDGYARNYLLPQGLAVAQHGGSHRTIEPEAVDSLVVGGFRIGNPEQQDPLIVDRLRHDAPPARQKRPNPLSLEDVICALEALAEPGIQGGMQGPRNVIG